MEMCYRTGNTLFEGHSCIFQPENFTGWGSEEVKRSRSFCQNAGSKLQLNTDAPYVCGFARSGMVHGCMVYTERAEMATVSRGTSHVRTKPLWWILPKTRYKSYNHSLRIACDNMW